MASALSAVSFGKVYSKKSAASGVCVQAERGKVTVLLGPNGAGKSTLLKAFAAAHYATSGKILFEENGAVLDAAEFPQKLKARTGFISEEPFLYDDWRTDEFLRMAASLRLPFKKGREKKIDQAVKSAASLCGLEGVLLQKIASLSHGYKQRLNFAQALVADPGAVILDEPANGLDPEQIKQMRSLVARLKKGRAVVLSTHIIQEAESLADTIYILSEGRVAASGTLQELLQASGTKSLEDAYLFFAATQNRGDSSPKVAAFDNCGAESGGAPESSAAPNDFSPASACTKQNAASFLYEAASFYKKPSFLSRAAAFFCLAKKELFAMAINPFYWIAWAAFCVFCSACFFYGTRFFVQGQGSANLSPFFSLMPYACCVIFPAFCMNIKSRAFDAFLPFGEFFKAAARLASYLAAFFLYLLPTLFVPVCAGLFGTVDVGAVFAACAGLLFFAASGLSLCIFLSHLFKGRAASFAASVVALYAVNSMHVVLNYLPLSDALSGAVRAASFAWRFDSASKGIFDTRDLLFFAGAALLFIALSAFVSERQKGKKYFCKKNAPRTWTIIFIFVFLFLDSGRIYKRIDLTAQKIYTPSKRTLDLLAGAEEKLRVSYYRSPELLRLYPQVRDVGDFLRSLSFSSKNVVYSELNASSASSQKILKTLSVRPFQIQNQKENSLEYIDCYSAIVIDCKDKTLLIPAAFSTFSLEYDLNLRLDFLLLQKSRSVYVVCANGMALEKDFKGAIDWLNIEGFETIALDAKDLGEARLDKSIPLVLFGTEKIDAAGADEIEHFLDKGGAVFAAAGPYSVNVDGDWSLSKNKRDFVLPVFERSGISFLDSLAADVSCIRADFYSRENGRDENKSVNYPLWISVLPQEGLPFGAAMFWASPISVRSGSARPLFSSSPSSWKFLPDKRNPDLAFDTNPFTVPKSAVEDPLVQKGQSVLCAQSLEKKLIVASGSLFLNDLLLSLSSGGQGDFRNLNFMTASLLRLLGEDDMAQLKNKGAADFSLWKIPFGQDWSRAKHFSLLLNLALLPAAIFALFAAFSLRRRADEKK